MKCLFVFLNLAGLFTLPVFFCATLLPGNHKK